MKVVDLWRYPIKGHGREQLTEVALSEGKTIPFDRVWAIAHEAAKVDGSSGEWAHCVNFSRGSKSPALMAINLTFDAHTNTITLTHPDCEPLTINPDVDEDAARLVEWTKPLCPDNRAQPAHIYRAKENGMTDSDFPSVSINSFSSLRSLSEKAGTDVSPQRFRGNIWIDDLPPWAEHNWVNQEIQIGEARLKIIERTERCAATTASPQTGKIDLDTLDILKSNFGHLDFGVRAIVTKSGLIKTGDAVSL